MLRRLMYLPRFYFAEAPQSIEGTPALTQATNLPSSPIPPPDDTPVHSSVPHPKAKPCRQSPKILLICATSSKNQHPSEKF
jgi:hypothetical protein